MPKSKKMTSNLLLLFLSSHQLCLLLLTIKFKLSSISYPMSTNSFQFTNTIPLMRWL